MSDTGIEHTLKKLKIEAYTDGQKEIHRLRAYSYFQSHRDEIRQSKELNIITTLILETKEESKEKHIMKHKIG